MSLWSKSLSDISFEDIDAFCKAGYSEGTQLDYKQEIPADLERTVAAFANTRGGLLLLGVKANKQNNKPEKWPCKGMQAPEHLSETITQICRDRIYPPILPEISPLIDDPNNPEHVFIVVRVDESSQVPHSIKNKTKVYIRTNDANHPFDLADIDRIEQLLNRRKAPQLLREALISRHLERVSDRHPGRRDPTVWFCISPEFPECSLFTLNDCRTAVYEGASKRVLDGWIEFRESKDPRDTIYSAAGKNGELFWSHSFGTETISAMFLANGLYRFVLHAQSMYHRYACIHPGLIRITVGFKCVRDFALVANFQQQFSSIDDEFRIDTTRRFGEITDTRSRFDVVFSLAEDFFHAFGAPQPPQRNHWELQ